MIVTDFDPKHGRCSLIAESAEDLWTLRRIIAEGDVVVTRSSRVVKNEDEFSRPDRGERVKVTIALKVSEVHLDSSVERIRLRGSIVEASDENVSKVGYHALTISPGHALTLRKEHWSPVEIGLVRPRGSDARRFLVIAVDRREAGIGTISGSHLSISATLESGLGGKMSEERSSSPFISKVVDIVAQTARDSDEIVLAGPGNFKGAVANQIRQTLGSHPVHVVEGFDSTGSDGVRALVKDQGFQKVAKGSLLVEMQHVVAEAVRRISTGDPKVAYSLARVREASSAGAVESCIVTDNIFSTGIDEKELVEVLNSIEAARGKVYLADSSIEMGKQVSSFGGIIALLRYQLRS